jgi:hypothetical protein
VGKFQVSGVVALVSQASCGYGSAYDLGEYAVYPHAGVIYDLTYETRDQMISQQAIAVAQNHKKQINFQTPFVPTKLTLELAISFDIPSNLVLDVNRIVFYRAQKTDK